MNRPLCSLLIVAAVAAAAMAQNQDQLQLQYNDALNQLKAAQSRKNELDAENARLEKRLEEITHQLQDKQQELDSVRNRSYFLQAHYTAWERFVDTNPAVKAMWSAYYQSRVPSDTLTSLFGDGHWPFTLPEYPDHSLIDP